MIKPVIRLGFIFQWNCFHTYIKCHVQVWKLKTWHSTVCSFIIVLRKSYYCCCNWIWLTQLYVVQILNFELWIVVQTVCLIFHSLVHLSWNKMKTRWRRLTVEGCSSSLFHSPSSPFNLWSVLWRYNSAKSWLLLEDLTFVKEEFYNLLFFPFQLSTSPLYTVFIHADICTTPGFLVAA